MGGRIARDATAFNRHLHPEEINDVKALAEEYAKRKGISAEEAEAKLLAQAYQDVDKEHSLDHSGTDVDAQNFLRQHARLFVDENGRIMLTFAPGSVEFYNDPNLYSDTPARYPQEWSSLLGAASNISYSEKQENIWSETWATASQGIWKGVANIP